jgi:hypothetical protein
MHIVCRSLSKLTQQNINSAALTANISENYRVGCSLGMSNPKRSGTYKLPGTSDIGHQGAAGIILKKREMKNVFICNLQ